MLLCLEIVKLDKISCVSTCCYASVSLPRRLLTCSHASCVGLSVCLSACLPVCVLARLTGVLSFPPRRPNLQLHAHIVRDDEERREEVVAEILGKHDARDRDRGRDRGRGSTALDDGEGNSDDDGDEEEGMFDFILSTLTKNKRHKGSRTGPPAPALCTTKAYALLPTIVYVWRRDEADSLADYLKSQDVSAAAYHAGMERSQRSRVQLLFNKGTIHVVVATVAFGMGIDKSNVRRVIHASLPKSVENYVQVM